MFNAKKSYNMHNVSYQADCQAENSFCKNLLSNVHAAFGAVCTFVLSVLLSAEGAVISALFALLIIAIIIISADNRIGKNKEISPYYIRA